jgi:hypothetical protein
MRFWFIATVINHFGPVFLSGSHHELELQTALEYTDSWVRLRLMSLEQRHRRADLIETYKIFHGFTRIKPEELFTLSTETRT